MGPAWTFCVTNHSRAPKPTRRLPPLSFQTLKAQRPVFATPWVARTPTLDTVRHRCTHNIGLYNHTRRPPTGPQTFDWPGACALLFMSHSFKHPKQHARI